jgi:hypothetical protein
LIYVKRDPNLIPEKILRVAERAQARLETIPSQTDRAGFIEKNGHIWRSFGRYLQKMSYGKCWYSESHDPQSFFDVDHFRPKKKALRDDGTAGDGYPWLAFSWENFRLSAGRCNRQNKDEETDETVGKGAWFPLLPGSPVATWENRCIETERPVLLDPTVRTDVDLLGVNPESGRMEPSMLCVGSLKRARVDRSIELFGLNLPRVTDARRAVMRRIESDYRSLIEALEEATDRACIERHREELLIATRSNSAYALAARSKLLALPNGGYFIARPED